MAEAANGCCAPEQATDWTGRAFSCEDCPHQEMRALGRCVLGRVCVRDVRARRIDKFFSGNPGLAGRYLDHPYFEVRTLAAKHASLFEIARLMSDKEAEVRAMVAMRLPLARVKDMRRDRDRKVRIACAMRLEGAELLAMAQD
uniref:4Fe4S-binding leucine-rich repeat protein n=1 Tax=Rhodoblastus sp. TaxID=1962975 RepID=UPI003F999700